MSDTRIVYGATCTWWDFIDKAGTMSRGKFSLPCCPYCQGPLFEVPDIEEWYKQCEFWPEIDYRAALDWCRGKCNIHEGWELPNGEFGSDNPPIYDLYLKKSN